MGKLLQKIVNGIVPSWLTRVKSSARASPKKLLPFSKGDTHVSSIKSSAISPASSSSNNVADHHHSSQSSKGENAVPVTARAESSANSASPPSMQHKTISMKQKDGKHKHGDDDQHHQHESHQFEDNHDHHHPHDADMEYSLGTQIHAPNLLYKKQDGKGIHDENHHPQHHYHWHHRDPNCNHVLLGFEKSSSCIDCMQEDDNSHHHQKAHGGNHEQPNAKHKCGNRSYWGLEREIGCVQEDNKRNHKDYGRRMVHNSHDHQSAAEQKNCHDLLGFKRKSRYSKEDEDEEDAIKGWGWKRRKREEGLMSCELPESICGVVGNGKAVVKYSQEPHLALWESMVEMIVGNGLWELGSLEFLLFCYLSLNEPHLHPTIQSSFLQVLKDLERTF